MNGEEILNCRREPYPHDYFINRVFLWAFPRSIKPNHITIFRFLATPVVFLFIYWENWHIAITLFAIVSFTDALDGSMARIRQEVTKWGTLFDPLADKLLISGALLILMFKYINIFIGGAIIFLEFLVIISGVLNERRGIVLSANTFGKVKMFLQVLGILLLFYSILSNSHDFMIIAEWTLILSIIFAMLNLTWKGARGL